jgi:hypothetical protein
MSNSVDFLDQVRAKLEELTEQAANGAPDSDLPGAAAPQHGATEDELAADGLILAAHSRKGGVYITTRSPPCARCGESMPCSAIRDLGAKYGLLAPEQAGHKGVQGPTGVRMRSRVRDVD